MKNFLVLIIVILGSLRAIGQTNQQINNELTFGKLYGYVRYFHPSDEAATIDWNHFLIYGSKQVAGCTDSKQLKEVLNSLFTPLVPTIQIGMENESLNFNRAALIPTDTFGYKTIAWQHVGVGLIKGNNSLYKSARTNRSDKQTVSNNTLEQHSLYFSQYPNVGEYVHKNIGSGLKVIFPIALYGNTEHTYPASDTIKVQQLSKELNTIKSAGINGSDLYTRIAGVIITWNIFQHFFPYFDFAKTDWKKDFRNALDGAYQDKNGDDFKKTLQRMTAKLKDGHIAVYSMDGNNDGYLPPIAWEWVEDKLVITQVLNDSINLHKGDIVTAINGEDPGKYFIEIKKYISAATPGYLTYKAQTTSLVDPNGTPLTLSVLTNNNITKYLTLNRTLTYTDYRQALPVADSIKKISGDIMYVNIGMAHMKTINAALPQLEKSKVIICDLRGYPTDNSSFIQYMLTQKDTAKQWMQIPYIIYPDQENIAGYDRSGWEMPSLTPHLNAKIIFIIDSEDISYAESYMSLIENYKLATIVGQPTAGTNGNINQFWLPGNYVIYWTGMKVLKLDGTQHHGVGTKPDIYVKKTIKGIREGRDEFLEKAIAIAQNNDK